MTIVLQVHLPLVVYPTKNTFPINADGYAKEVEVKMPLGQPTVNKVGGQKRMLASKKSTVKWY